MFKNFKYNHMIIYFVLCTRKNFVHVLVLSTQPIGIEWHHMYFVLISKICEVQYSTSTVLVQFPTLFITFSFKKKDCL